MALVTFGPMFYPELEGEIFSSQTVGGTLALNSSTIKQAYMFRAPKDGTLNRVGFRTGTVSTGDTIRVSFQGVTGTGPPDEVVDQFVSVPILSTDDNLPFFVGPLTDDGTITGVKRTVVRNDWVACVFDYQTYVAGNINLTSDGSQGQSRPGRGGYTMTKSGGTWTRLLNQPVMVLEYDDGSYEWIPGVKPWTGGVTAVSTFNNGSTPDERGNVINLPARVRVGGLYAHVQNGTSLTADFDIVLYDSNGTTVLATGTIDDEYTALPATNSMFVYTAWLSSDVTLEPDVDYRVSIKPTTSENLTTHEFSMPSVAAMDMLSGGQRVYATERTDGGAWSNTTTKRSRCGVIINGLENGG